MLLNVASGNSENSLVAVSEVALVRPGVSSATSSVNLAATCVSANRASADLAVEINESSRGGIFLVFATGLLELNQDAAKTPW
jgi:hypothetical protein